MTNFDVIDTNSNTTFSIHALKRAGVKAVGRYYSSSASKKLTLAEAEALSQAGIQIFVVFEDSASPRLDFDTGVHHAQIALAQAKGIKQPSGSAIYFALDTELGDDDLPRVEEYFAGIQEVIGATYNLGVYGDGRVCERLLTNGVCKYTWLSASRGFPGSRDFYASKRYSLAQDPQIDQERFGLSIDLNEFAGDYGAFLLAAATGGVRDTALVEQLLATSVTAQPEAEAEMASLLDFPAFVRAVQGLFGGEVNDSQKEGLTAILTSWNSVTPGGDPRWLAYMLATAFHETNKKMLPVREAYLRSEDWRRQHFRYYPYYGRGYVQLTWERNYAKASKVVGSDLVAKPDDALRLDYAARIMQQGMTEGWFRQDRAKRPHNLARYFGSERDDPEGARNIINGPEWRYINGRRTLLASVIADYYNTFLSALQAYTTGAAETLENADSSLEAALATSRAVGLRSDIGASLKALIDALEEASYTLRSLSSDADDVQEIDASDDLLADPQEDPAAPAPVGEVVDKADFDRARTAANLGADTSDAVQASAAAPKVGFDFAAAQAFLTACETSVPRVTYGLGKKVPFLDAQPGRDFRAVDCSGFIREVVRLSTSPALSFPDGSVNQHDWVREHGFPRCNVQDGMRSDDVTRVAFLRPQDSSQRIGHVVLINQGWTLESHGGVGPDTRVWDGKGWQAKAYVYEFAQNGELLASMQSPSAVSEQKPAVFTVHTGHRYRATLALSGFDQLATNDMVKSRLEGLGFSDVTVSGSGQLRQAEGTWQGPTTSAQMDDRIVKVEEVGTPAATSAPSTTDLSRFEVPPEPQADLPSPSQNDSSFESPPDMAAPSALVAPAAGQPTSASMPYSGSSFAIGNRAETNHTNLLQMHAVVQSKIFERGGAVALALGADPRPQAEHNIVGVGIGAAHRDFESVGPAGPGAPVLNVYVAEPMTMDSVKSVLVDKMGLDALKADSQPVNVFHTGPIDALVHRHKERRSPCGISVAHFKVTAGTQGVLAVGRNDPRKARLLMVSNNHVLANANDCAVGDPILQPGPYDLPPDMANKIAVLERWVPIDYTSAGQNYVDCATAWCWPDRVRPEFIYRDGSSWQYFQVKNTPIEATRGMLVGKSGRTTQLTCGSVLDVSASIQVNYGNGRVANFVDQFTVRGANNQNFSDGGDSGSLIWSWEQTRSPVGLLFAGGGQLTFGNKIGHVLEALDVAILP